MIPGVNHTLEVCAAKLDDLASSVSPAFRGADIRYVALLMRVAANDFDGAAHRLVIENRALRTLLSDVRPLLEDALTAEVDTLLASRDDDLHVSALTVTNDRLRALLIDVHAVVEGQDGADARSAENAIWAELSASTERRAKPTDVFY